jgi:endogenous inhibitor of DNA gyrase (YacG/DUF329 family)
LKPGGRHRVEPQLLEQTYLSGMFEKMSVVTKQRREFVKRSPDMKAPARACRGCGTDIPAQSSGPGRPREFCTRRCRRDLHHAQEQASIERERAEEQERQRFEYERYHYGTRAAKQMARDRAKVRSGGANGRS